MICTTCGREERLEANFCSNCGRVFAWQNARAGVPPYTQPYAGQLVRPHGERMVAGVCAGLAMHYGWDVSLLRILFLLSVLFAGVPLIAYLVAWIVIPNAPYLLPAGMPVSPVAPQATGTMGR